MDTLLKMEDITKEFPGVKALNGVSFDLQPGEIHALIGENGAGKSTLMKILTGIYKQDAGTIKFNDKPFSAMNPKHAQDQGISMIHQEFNLIPDLTVAENIYLAREPRHFRNLLIDDRTMIGKSQKLINSLGLKIHASTLVKNLSVAEMQMVEIVKALVVESEILVLDEPTSALSEKEVTKLFEIIKHLKSSGVGIIYISHRLEEFDALVDRVTVLRDGKFVATREWNDVGIPDLIRMMVGRTLSDQYPRRDAHIGEVVFRAEHISQGKKLKDISFEVRSGEVLGIDGLMGAGRTELARAIFGADKIDHGSVWLEGNSFTPRSPVDAILRGIAYLPEDRKKEGLFLDLEVDTNLLSANLTMCSRYGIIDDKLADSIVQRKIEELKIKTPSSRQIVKFLSGGNQQKVLVARWLCKDAKVVIFDEPTRGIDVGAKYEIYNLMNAVAERGSAVIMISSEMSEILGMSDRIVVMCEGKVTGELSAAEATQEKLMHLASNPDGKGGLN